MEEIHLVVDTKMVIVGLHPGHEEHSPYHAKLLREIESRVFLALDGESLENKGQVLLEYERMLGSFSTGTRWLAHLASEGRIRFYQKLPPLPKGLRVKLDEEHFSPDDRKFVRLALATKTRRLVAEDDDYTERVCKILAGKPTCVHVHSAESICHWIEANLGGPLPV